MTINSGLISQSTTGDQMYQCVVQIPHQPTRTHKVTIKGSRLYLILTIL